MPKKFYQVDEPCEKCGTPTIQGPKGVYCKPCYVAWKNQSKPPAAPVNGYHPQSVQTPTQAPIAPPASNPGVLEALQKISTHLNSIDQELERQKWFLDEVLKRLDPKWSALSQDEPR